MNKKFQITAWIADNHGNQVGQNRTFKCDSCHKLARKIAAKLNGEQHGISVKLSENRVLYVVPEIFKEKNMKPETKIQATILLDAAKNGDVEIPDNLISLTDDEINKIYFDWSAGDYESEFRYGKAETKIECDWSRHYESKSVAAKMFDGSWVGWTYWYGGGKFGEPEAIDWMSDSYDLDCVEKEETVINRYFTKFEE